MSRYYILDEAGSPVPTDDVMTWARWFENARLWLRLRQRWCNHAAATAHRIPGFSPPRFERRCGRCDLHWTEDG